MAGFTPNELFFGVMTTVVGTIPKGYQWIANMLGLNGKISEGNALVLKYILANDENNKKESIKELEEKITKSKHIINDSRKQMDPTSLEML